MGISQINKLMKILVVGSDGFLGSWVNRILAKDKSFEVISISGKKQVDLTNYAAINEFVRNNKPDHIINCAAFVGGISYGYKFPARMLYENVEMALNLYKVSHQNKVKSLINPISNCAYPGNLNTYKEEDFLDGPPHESVFNYAISKRITVNLGESYFKEFNLSSSNVVLSNMYGPNDHFDIERSHALGALVKKICDAKNNNFKTVEIWGSGKPIREWLYVEDGATALIKSIHLSAGHNFLNVGVKKGVSILDLAYRSSSYIEDSFSPTNITSSSYVMFPKTCQFLHLLFLIFATKMNDILVYRINAYNHWNEDVDDSYSQRRCF